MMIFGTVRNISRKTLACLYGIALPCQGKIARSCGTVTCDSSNVYNYDQMPGSYVQEAPILTNPFVRDHFLQRCLKQELPKEVYSDVVEDLTLFGQRIVSEVENLGRAAELHPPTLRSHDAWGKHVNELTTCQAWKDLHSISAVEGMVALAYEKKHMQWSRLHQMAKLFLFSPSSGLYSCPLAMTDGAAKLIETSQDHFIQDKAFSHLTSRNPEHFWTSGQWMTERKGGSDVGASTCTVARATLQNNLYLLSGEKWFSSATDSEMAFTLARVMDEEGSVTEGSRGLSLFYLETKLEDGSSNNIRIQRLKNKLGTRQLPTAELLLDGTVAYLVGEPGSGVANIFPLLTISRLHNSISSIAVMRRMMQLCTDYASRRTAFGKLLSQHPLHMQILSRMELQTRGSMLLTMELSRLLGLSECSMSSPQEELLLRILVPLAKLYTAKQAVAIASEGLEAIGGQGYIEDTGLPTLLRDAQVLPIWEGTTNVLSLDVAKTFMKHKPDIHFIYKAAVRSNLENTDELYWEEQIGHLNRQSEYVTDIAEKVVSHDPAVMNTAARDFAFSLAHIYIGSLLVKMASRKDSTACDRDAAVRWCGQPIPLTDIEVYEKQYQQKDFILAMN